LVFESPLRSFANETKKICDTVVGDAGLFELAAKREPKCADSNENLQRPRLHDRAVFDSAKFARSAE
jgi:hypothetical protein